jgi:hypothetical protein
VLVAVANGGLEVVEMTVLTEVTSNFGDTELQLEGDGLHRRRVDGVADPLLFVMHARAVLSATRGS